MERRGSGMAKRHLSNNTFSSPFACHIRAPQHPTTTTTTTTTPHARSPLSSPDGHHFLSQTAHGEPRYCGSVVFDDGKMMIMIVPSPLPPILAPGRRGPLEPVQYGAAQNGNVWTHDGR